jgi:pimeloyl-ACP methyl ester carboxylesterase
MPAVTRKEAVMDVIAETRRMVPIYTPGHVLPGGKSVINAGGVQAYEMQDGTLLIPGTNSDRDWWSFNFNFGTVLGQDIDWALLDKAVGNARWYRGFALHAKIVFDALGSWRPKAIVGHSLGAASAQILGAVLGVPTLALAGPRPRRGKTRLKNEGWVLNVVYERDLIMLAPPFETGYRYVGTSRILKAPAGDTRALHNPAEYLPVMTAQIAAQKLEAVWPRPA